MSWLTRTRGDVYSIQNARFIARLVVRAEQALGIISTTRRPMLPRIWL
jgi:hypothetical protein